MDKKIDIHNGNLAKRDKVPRLINLFAWGLIITSLGQMTGMGWNRYIWLFQELPQFIIYLRYSVTWSLRILGLSVGIGLLCRKEIFRKLGMGLFWFVIFTVYLKHTHYPGFERHIQSLVNQGMIDLSILKTLGIHYSAFVWAVIVIACLGDVLFAAAFIFYFRKPRVREVFH